MNKYVSAEKARQVKSCITVGKASAKSAKHNSRQYEPDYLLPKEFRQKNIYVSQPMEDIRADFQEQYAKKYSNPNKKGGKRVKFENCFAEAVLNLPTDFCYKKDKNKIQNLLTKMCDEFNLVVASLAVHVDEGCLIDAQTGDILSPQIDYYTRDGVSYAIKNGKKTDEKLDLSKYYPRYNKHVHVVFYCFSDGINQRTRWNRQDMKKMQNIVAECLEMERGVDYQSQNKFAPKHLQPRQFAKLKHTERKLKNAEIKNLKISFEAIRKDMRLKNAELKENGKPPIFVREHYAYLDELKKQAILAFEAGKNYKIPTMEDISQINELQTKIDDKNKIQQQSQRSTISSSVNGFVEGMNDNEYLNETISYAQQQEAQQAQIQAQKDREQTQKTKEEKQAQIDRARAEIKKLQGAGKNKSIVPNAGYAPRNRNKYAGGRLSELNKKYSNGTMSISDIAKKINESKNQEQENDIIDNDVYKPKTKDDWNMSI